jgi:hypothetical protein
VCDATTSISMDSRPTRLNDERCHAQRHVSHVMSRRVTSRHFIHITSRNVSRCDLTEQTPHANDTMRRTW